MSTTQQIANGRYILNAGGKLLRQDKGQHAILADQRNDDSERWEVASDGNGSYTLRNVATGLYLGSSTDPNTLSPTLPGTAEPFAWKIQPSPHYPDAFCLFTSSSNGATALCSSIFPIFPPPAAWAPVKSRPPEHYQLKKV